MAEYIEREAALTEIENADVMCDIPADAYRVLRRYVDRIPAADVVPVVRCKNCTHSREGKESLECEKHRYAWDNRLRWVDDNDFCCWGVRKDMVTDCNQVKDGDGDV